MNMCQVHMFIQIWSRWNICYMSQFYLWTQPRFAQVGLVVCVILVMLVSWWLPVYRSYVTVAPAYDLHAFFEDSALTLNKQKLQFLRKWQGDITVRIFSHSSLDIADNLNQLETAMSLLSRLTGFKFTIVEEDRAGLRIVFMTHAELVETMPEINPTSYNQLVQSGQPLTNMRCYSIINYGSDESPHLYGPVTIVVSTDLPQTSYWDAFVRRVFLDGPEVLHHSCLMEELMNSFGFFEDTRWLSPSAIHHTPSDQILSANDKLLIRTLYDSRLKAGMPREEALVVAKQVIEELVAAYEVHGEEALYQR